VTAQVNDMSILKAGDNGRKRQDVRPAALAGDGQLAGPPAHVSQPQPGDFPAAQRQPRQGKDDRVVTAPAGALPVTCGQGRAQVIG
jgi:hypothetical protein